MTQMVSIKISGKTLQAERGANLLEIAQSARLDMTATCGARGRCRSCRVRLVRGKLNPPTLEDRVQLGAEGVHEGFRLGCQTQVLDDCEVEITPVRGTILKAINDYIKEACKQVDIEAKHLYKIIVVGNTCMHHIFLGMDTSNVGLAPYAPNIRKSLVLDADDIPLKSAPNAKICLLPIIAGFVGADTVGTIIASRLHESDEIRALVDIGTNGEVVMGNRDRLFACSAPAGPALEGGESPTACAARQVLL
ncbi:MAG: DUF4445 domain-containing protein [Rhizobiaceae bacterium]|nr:DUF4445 domain-containing protein [Rhizobiaceae bacterium]